MKDREDLHEVLVVNEVDREREAPRKNAASLQENGRICERVLRCPFYCSVELEEELDTQPRLFRFVPCRRLIGFSLRARLNVDWLQARRSFISN